MNTTTIRTDTDSPLTVDFYDNSRGGFVVLTQGPNTMVLSRETVDALHAALTPHVF